MLEQMTKDIARKQMQELFPHALIPGAMLAEVKGISPLGTYAYKDIEIEGCSECEPYTAKLTGKWYEYTLRILTRDGTPDPDFPEIPGVKSKFQIPQGGKAAVVMLYGELRPYIVGEAM